jgi:hypothetical protein
LQPRGGIPAPILARGAMAEMADVIDGVAEAASGSPETLPTHFTEAGDLHPRYESTIRARSQRRSLEYKRRTSVRGDVPTQRAAPRARSTERRSSPRTTVTSSRCATTHSSSSIPRATVSQRSFARKTSIAPGGWYDVLLPIIDRYRRRGKPVVVRADAAFATPALYETLERRGVRYAIRLPANDVLERQIEDLLTRPRGRPSHTPLVRCRSFQYQAASWDRPRRVIAKSSIISGSCCLHARLQGGAPSTGLRVPSRASLGCPYPDMARYFAEQALGRGGGSRNKNTVWPASCQTDPRRQALAPREYRRTDQINEPLGTRTPISRPGWRTN